MQRFGSAGSAAIDKDILSGEAREISNPAEPTQQGNWIKGNTYRLPVIQGSKQGVRKKPNAVSRLKTAF